MQDWSVPFVGPNGISCTAKHFAACSVLCLLWRPHPHVLPPRSEYKWSDSHLVGMLLVTKSWACCIFTISSILCWLCCTVADNIWVSSSRQLLKKAVQSGPENGEEDGEMADPLPNQLRKSVVSWILSQPLCRKKRVRNLRWVGCIY